jgi:hypothetical protein
MASAIDRGCATYDLYGIDAQGDRADHAYRRLSQFKRHFGGANRVYAGAQDLYSYDRIADAMLPFLQHLAVEEVPASRPAPGSCTRAPSPPARETPGTFPDRKRKGVNQP